jgi:hypothetical protein
LNDEDVSTYTHAFSCLGSTIKQAGSKQAFYAIDYEINAHFADLIQDKNIHLLVVSALGANANSPVFYNKVKGELENYLKSLSMYKLSIFQPSLLIGKRSEVRVLEDVAQTLFKLVEKTWTKPFKYKPVTAEQLAHTMLNAAQTQTAAFKLYDNLIYNKPNNGDFSVTTIPFVTCDLLDDNPEKDLQVVTPSLDGKFFKSYGARKSFGGQVVTVKCFEDNSR